ncbi:MAG: cyanophycinase, partial [Bacteroidota bacterium]
MYNIKFHLILSLIAFFFIGGVAQESYTKYETGSNQDVVTQPQGGVCMMGGSTESDDAMRWFLERADGGDVLVIRASGSDGYNEYLHSELGVSINSVTTIVFQEAVAAEETYVQDKIKQAEAIWIAGGDQWKYVQYWRHTSVASLINEALASRNIVVGGTSAGMAILGGFYFTAQNGTIRSEDALNNPYDDRITLDSTSFIANNYLKNVLTDTHYDDPDRSGRHTAFLARVLVDYGVVARGIACEEYTAVCIDENGIARVFGGYPTYDDFAYFIQPNCQMNSPLPESCRPDEQLTWNLEETALQVYKIAGT